MPRTNSVSASPRGSLAVAIPVAIAVALALLLQGILAWVYQDFILELAGDSTVGHSGGALEIVLSYAFTALAAAACALYCVVRTGPSRIPVVIQLAAVIVPLQALLVAHFEFARPEFANAVALAYIGTLLFCGLMPDLRVPRPTRMVRVAFLIIGLLITIYVYAALIARGGLSRFSFDLSAVYTVREEFLEDYAPFIGYLVPWQAYVINPALLLISFRRRSLSMGAIGIALQLLLFGMTGYRAFLLIPFLMAGILLIARWRNLTAGVLAGVLAVIGIALALYAWLAEPLIPTLLVDRVIVVPAELHYWYYDFFGVNGQPLLQLSQSLLSGLGWDPYQTSIAEVIGWKYLGSAASANVGLYADAFANFGFAGCALYALLFGIVLKVIDAAGGRTDPRIAAALMAMPAFQLVNSGLLTTLLTHGLAAAILVLWALTSPFANRAETPAMRVRR